MTPKFLAKVMIVLLLREEQLNQFDIMGLKELVGTFSDFRKSPSFL